MRLTNRPSPVGRAGSPLHAVQFAIHVNGAHGDTRPTDHGEMFALGGHKPPRQRTPISRVWIGPAGVSLLE
jgi:hypothetical protein